jgi:hypothetical protein
LGIICVRHRHGLHRSHLHGYRLRIRLHGYHRNCHQNCVMEQNKNGWKEYKLNDLTEYRWNDWKECKLTFLMECM